MVGVLNDAAWFLATSPDVEIRNPPESKMYAEKAVAGTGRMNASYLSTLAAAYAAAGQFTNAVSVQREAIDLLQDGAEKQDYASRLPLFESNQPYRDDGELADCAHYLLTKGKFAEAEPLLRECLALREKQIPDGWRTFSAKSMLGGALLGQKKYSGAAPFLLSGYEGMKEREGTIPVADKVRLKQALERLFQYCEATGQPDQAAKWKQKLGDFEHASSATQQVAPSPTK